MLTLSGSPHWEPAGAPGLSFLVNSEGRAEPPLSKGLLWSATDVGEVIMQFSWLIAETKTLKWEQTLSV